MSDHDTKSAVDAPHSAGGVMMETLDIPITRIASIKGNGMALSQTLLTATGLPLPKSDQFVGTMPALVWVQPGQWLAIGIDPGDLTPVKTCGYLFPESSAWVALQLSGEVMPLLQMLFGFLPAPSPTVGFLSLRGLHAILLPGERHSMLLLPRSGARWAIGQIGDAMDSIADNVDTRQ